MNDRFTFTPANRPAAEILSAHLTAMGRTCTLTDEVFEVGKSVFPVVILTASQRPAPVNTPFTKEGKIYD